MEHNANPSYKLASVPRYDDIERTADWAGSARAAGGWRGGVLRIARRIWEVGVAGSPVIGRRRGAFSTLLRRTGLQASTGGVLATKSERKMLASTCLYSIYAWFCLSTVYVAVCNVEHNCTHISKLINLSVLVRCYIKSISVEATCTGDCFELCGWTVLYISSSVLSPGY